MNLEQKEYINKMLASIIAFDELDNPLWPGETRALLETIGINALKIKRIDFDPYIGYAVI